MRTIVTLLCVVLTAGAIGCGKSSQSSSEKIRQQVDLARRHYVRALGLMNAPVGEVTAAPVGQTNDQALAALNDARKALSDALATPEASIGAKVSAQRLLAEVQKSTGDYYAHVAETAARQLIVQLSQSDRYLSATQVYTSLVGFYDQLAKMDPSEIQQMKDQAQAQQADVSQQKQALEAKLAALNEQVDSIAAENNTKLAAAADLRNQSRAARGPESLALLKKAGEIDRQINANNAKINELKASQETLQEELKSVTRILASDNLRLEAMTQRLSSLSGLTAESKDQKAAQSQKAQELSSKLLASLSDVAGTFKAVSAASDQALSEYEQATRANQAALAGLDDQRSKANQVRQEHADSSVDPILASMGGQSERAALTAQKGDIALASGDVRRQLLESLARVQALQQQVQKGVPAIAGQAPLAEAVAVVKDAEAMKQAAQEDYTAAAAAYESASKFAAAVPKAAGVDMKAVLWLYQGQKARALLGSYYLTGESQNLSDARTIVETILQENPDNPYVEPIRQISQQMPAGAGA